MRDEPPARILVVVQRPAAMPAMAAAVRERAARGACSFTLLVPGGHRLGDAERAAAVIARGRRTLEAAAGDHVHGIAGHADPFIAVRDVVDSGHFDEILMPAPSRRFARWLHRDLPVRVAALGVPVGVVAREPPDPGAPGLPVGADGLLRPDRAGPPAG